MFVVGKEYKSRGSGDVYTCQWASTSWALLLVNSSGRPEIVYQKDPLFEEHVQPVKAVRYFNVYEEGIGEAYLSRKIADSGSTRGRIACKRVEFEVLPGTFDD